MKQRSPPPPPKPKKPRSPTGNPMGLPSKLNRALLDRICEFIRAGNLPDVAAGACGINRQTFIEWMKEGARIRDRLGPNSEMSPQRQILVDLSKEVEKAQDVAQARDVMTIGNAAKKDWRASAWLLERRNKGIWLPTNRTELSGPEGGPVEVKSWEALAKLAEKAGTK